MTRAVPNILLMILALNVVWFFLYSANLGLRALTSDAPPSVSRVFFDSAPLANTALALHMVAGAVLAVAAPVQAMPVLRRRWPGVHRRAGYVLFILALVTGVGGLTYIALRGTIGGWWMSLWFAIYGIAMIWAGAATVYYAIDKNMRRHFRWATRLVILAVGSWIYRMHYAIWYSLTDRLGSNPEFTGPFDLVQVFAFFVPYLMIAELFLRRGAHK